MPAHRKALIVRGGWSGHRPVEATDRFVPFLQEQGFEVRIEESTAVYADAAALAQTDLIVQCVTMGEIAGEEIAGLRAAIEAGTGFTGWHGGIADSFRASSDYLQLVGGIFASHPAVAAGVPHAEDEQHYRDYTVNITALGRQHPITAATTHPSEPEQQWHRPHTSPAVWTRQWGAGRIVVSTPGHSLDVIDDPNVRTIIERGMLWAARTASAS